MPCSPALLPRPKPPEYDAFLSYAHRDRQVTAAIQKGLHQIGRRLGRLRALRVFRDDTDLTASPDLWGKITEALDRSRFMIVVLSPQSAGSYWVNEEIKYWLAHHGNEQLMFMLAEGHLRWDSAQQRFDPEHSDAAPPALTTAGSLLAEPLYVDVSDDAPWDLGSLTFRDKVTALAAPIHGKPKDALASDDLRERRQFRRLRAAAISGLVVLTVVAVVAALVAVGKQHEADQRLRDAVVAKLNAEGASMLAGTTPGTDVRAIQELLAANAIHADGVPILNAQISRFTTEKIVDTGSPLLGVAYRPDGRRIATAHADGTVRQWDSASGRSVGVPCRGHTDRVRAVAYTRDGSAIASVGLDGATLLCNADTGKALHVDPDRMGSGYALSVSSDGQLMLTGGANDTVQLWDPRRGQLRSTLKVFGDATAPINDIVFGPLGDVFAAADRTTVAIYDTKTLTPRRPNILVQGPDEVAAIQRIAFSPDGHSLAVTTNDLQMWDVDTGTRIWRAPLGVPRHGVVIAEGLAFSPDGSRLVTGREDGVIQVWDAKSGNESGNRMLGHTDAVDSTAFRGDGRQIATAGADGTLRLWNATVGQTMRSVESFLTRVAFSPDGKKIGAAGDTTIQQWDVTTGEPLPPLVLAGETPKYFGYTANDRIVTSARGEIVQAFDSNTQRPVGPPVQLSPQAEVPVVAFSADGRRIAVGRQRDGVAQLWDAEAGKPLGPPMVVSTRDKFIYTVAFSPDGRHLIAGYDNGLQLWNGYTARPEGSVIRADNVNPVDAVAFSRDGRALAASTLSGIQLWDLATREMLPHSPLRAQKSMVSSLAFGVGHQLASGSVDQTVLLWDTASAQPAAAPQAFPDSIVSLAISPDGKLAATIAADGSLLLSPAIADTAQLCDKLPANMSHKQWRQWVSASIDYITVCPGLPVAAD